MQDVRRYLKLYFERGNKSEWLYENRDVIGIMSPLYTLMPCFLFFNS